MATQKKKPTPKKPTPKTQTATADSTAYYSNQAREFGEAAARNMNNSSSDRAFKNQKEALDNMFRQSNKGKPGYDANGFPVKKKAGGNVKKYKSGGSTKAHPGFKAVQSSIAKKQGISKQAAGAILASSTRKASATAKRKNPNLKKVKG